MPDDKPVPQPGEAGRQDEEIHYHEVDETDVGDANPPEKPPAHDPRRPEADD